MVVNEKITETGKLMNAIGHALIGLAGTKVSEDEAYFVNYVDGDGMMHPSISHYPVIVLKGKNSYQIAKIRAEAEARDVPFTDFLSTMQIGTTQQQLDATHAAKGEGVNYMAICLFGNTDTLKEFTGKLSLFK